MPEDEARVSHLTCEDRSPDNMTAVSMGRTIDLHVRTTVGSGYVALRLSNAADLRDWLTERLVAAGMVA